MSELLAMLECERAYSHKYVERLQSKRFQGIPRPVGTAIHKGVELVWRGRPRVEAVQGAIHEYDRSWRAQVTVAPSIEDMDKIDEGRGQVRACVQEYPHEPQGEEIVWLEKDVIVDMGSGRGLKVRLDREVRVNQDWWLHDTKTTGSSSLDLVARGYKLSKQFCGYSVAAEQECGEPVTGVLIDIIRKPRTYKRKDGTVTVGEAAFLREPRAFTRDDIDGFRDWFHAVVNRIEANKIDGMPTSAWLQNTGSCTKWNRVCEFWDLCARPQFAEALKLAQYEERPVEGLEGGVEVEE